MLALEMRSVTNVLLNYALNVTELAEPHFNSCLCKIICHENKTITVNHFHSLTLLLALLIKHMNNPNLGQLMQRVFSDLINYAKEKQNKTSQAYSVYFPVFLKSRIGNRYLCFLSRSANSCRPSHHKHGGRGLYKLSREKPTGIHNRKKPLPWKPILLGLESKFPLKQLCILIAAGSLV